MRDQFLKFMKASMRALQTTCRGCESPNRSSRSDRNESSLKQCLCEIHFQFLLLRPAAWLEHIICYI